MHPLVLSHLPLLQLDIISHVDSGKSLFNFHPRKHIDMKAEGQTVEQEKSCIKGQKM